ncbi:MAG TPA: papain-like cysteine protease family protein [Bryobacteraceae bacterium]|nr:papain-like cysteine protease family protein [Bryobacteraceae bacterium]
MPRIAFEMERQQHSNWCWAAVATSVSRYFDPDSGWCQCRMASRMARLSKLKVKTCGTCGKSKRVAAACNRPWYLEKALALADRLKGQPKPKPLKFSRVRKRIKAGNPVCARILWGQGPDAHFVVISGCYRSKSGELWVDVEDPDSGSSTWRYDEFLSNYQYAQGQWVATYPV